MKDITIKTIGWTTFGITFIIMFYGMFISVAVSNADIKTEHIITINMDNETQEAMKYLSKIQEFQMRENNLFCENQLLNQSKYYDNQLSQLVRWYEVDQFEGTN